MPFLAPWTEVHQGRPLIVFSTLDSHQNSSTTHWAFLFYPAILAAQPAQIAVHLTLMRPPRPVNLSDNIIKAVQQQVQILCLFTHTHTNTAELKRSPHILAILSAPECELRNSGERAAVFIP